MKYDYLVVGAGLFGSVFAHEMQKRGKKCLVVEKRHHIGGNCYTENRDGINVHMYGPHIFHTSSPTIWNYVNSLVPFRQYEQHTKALTANGVLYSFPINLMTCSKIWPHCTSPHQVKLTIQSEQKKIKSPANLEEWALSQIGPTLYELFIKGYTEKQWGRPATQLPASILRRIPIRYSTDDNYFDDTYQGIPEGGYTQMFQALLKGIDLELNVSNWREYTFLANKVVFTGPIDEYFNHVLGRLEYRSLTFDHQYKPDVDDFQGCSIINWTGLNVDFTRVVEHKHFEKLKTKGTWVTYESPKEFGEGDEPYYPINDTKNMELFRKYEALATSETNTIFGGRLGTYRYYDMHQVIAAALDAVQKETKAK